MRCDISWHCEWLKLARDLGISLRDCWSCLKCQIHDWGLSYFSLKLGGLIIVGLSWTTGELVVLLAWVRIMMLLRGKWTVANLPPPLTGGRIFPVSFPSWVSSTPVGHKINVLSASCRPESWRLPEKPTSGTSLKGIGVKKLRNWWNKKLQAEKNRQNSFFDKVSLLRIFCFEATPKILGLVQKSFFIAYVTSYSSSL